MEEQLLDNKLIDVTRGPVNPQQIGGIMDGDGDCGPIESIPPFVNV